MQSTEIKARLATLDELKQTTIPAFFSPVPSDETLRNWFLAAKVPYFKANPVALRGGGPIYWSVSGVEKFLRSRTKGVQ
jgi:hypothetical protein